MYCEDKTGTGLGELIRRWVFDGFNSNFHIPSTMGRVHGANELLRQCEKFQNLAGGGKRRHVVYIIDGYAAWDLGLAGLSPRVPPEPLESYADKLVTVLKTEMERRASGGRAGEDGWKNIRDAFHAHVLLWERESLLLPVLEHLGFGPSIANSFETPHAAGVVAARFLERDRRSPYSKSVDGPRLLAKIAASAELRMAVLQAVPSFRTIVEDIRAIAEAEAT